MIMFWCCREGQMFGTRSRLNSQRWRFQNKNKSLLQENIRSKDSSPQVSHSVSPHHYTRGSTAERRHTSWRWHGNRRRRLECGICKVDVSPKVVCKQSVCLSASAWAKKKKRKRSKSELPLRRAGQQPRGAKVRAPALFFCRLEMWRW